MCVLPLSLQQYTSQTHVDAASFSAALRVLSEAQVAGHFAYYFAYIILGERQKNEECLFTLFYEIIFAKKIPDKVYPTPLHYYKVTTYGGLLLCM